MDRDPDTAEPLSDGALALLAWQAAMGADEAVAEQAIDWANLILPRVPARAPARVGSPMT